jgi:hypothetical protein
MLRRRRHENVGDTTICHPVDIDDDFIVGGGVVTVSATTPAARGGGNID